MMQALQGTIRAQHESKKHQMNVLCTEPKMLIVHLCDLKTANRERKSFTVGF